VRWPIKTRSDYRSALAAIEALMNARRGSRDGDRLDVLVTLVEAYEARHFPMDPASTRCFLGDDR
jgi:HTH-type transcriptional regulator/antitoxin HigA